MIIPLTESYDTLVSVLRAGGIAIAPCDTVYGIIGVAPDTEPRIARVKCREEGKRFLQLVSDAEWVARMTGREAPRSLRAYWPGPLTILFPLGGGSVALRVPDSPYLRRLIDDLGKPLYSTSVNRAGSVPLASITEIVKEFGNEVDLVVDGGTLAEGVPSTIVDIGTVPFRVVRQGALVVPKEHLSGRDE